jgi:hypothetical protein
VTTQHIIEILVRAERDYPRALIERHYVYWGSELPGVGDTLKIVNEKGHDAVVQVYKREFVAKEQPYEVGTEGVKRWELNLQQVVLHCHLFHDRRV